MMPSIVTIANGIAVLEEKKSLRITKKERNTMTKEQQLRAMRKIRGDWGGVKPFTRIERNKKKYTRKQKHKMDFP